MQLLAVKRKLQALHFVKNIRCQGSLKLTNWSLIIEI